MRIPNSIDTVTLSEDTIAALSVRTGIPVADLEARLQRDREKGATSKYVFSLYITTTEGN